MKLSDLNHVLCLVRERQRIAIAIARAKKKMEEYPAFIAEQEVAISTINEKIIAAVGTNVDFDFDTDNIANYTLSGPLNHGIQAMNERFLGQKLGGS
jgi:hypothetical protein